MMISTSLALTYFYLLIYILLSSGVILYNKWVLSQNYFNFPFPITLTMIHMGFSGIVAFFLVRVFKVVTPVKMTFEIYATCVIPISAFFASSLWFGNTAYLHISVAFIQMLKALMPVATFLMAVVCGTDKLRCDVLFNMVLVSVGVVISSYGEIHFNIIGTIYQVSGIFAEALRLVLTQVLLQKKGLTLNPITSLYYIAPCSFLFLFIPWYLIEQPVMKPSQIQFNFWIFFSNAVCALALNFSIFLVIGRTGAVTIRVAGVLKDWILIALSTVVFPESTITGLNIIGYAIALIGVVMYNYLKIKDVRASQSALPEKVPERVAKVGIILEVFGKSFLGLEALWKPLYKIAPYRGKVESILLPNLALAGASLSTGLFLLCLDWKFEKKSSDIYSPNDDTVNDGGSHKGNDSVPEIIVDEEAPLVLSSSRLSHIGRTQVSN